MSLYNKVNVGGGGGSFLELPDDKMVRVRILDYPYVSSQTFESDDGTVNISTKFTWEVYDYEANAVKLLSKGPMVFNQIKDIVEMQGEDVPAPFDIGVKKTGSGMATRYSVVSAPVKENLPKDLQRIEVTKIIKNAIPLSEFADGKELKKDDKDWAKGVEDTIIEMPDGFGLK